MIEQVRTSIGRGIELSGGHQHSRGIFTLTCLDFIMATRLTMAPWSVKTSLRTGPGNHERPFKNLRKWTF